MRLPLLTIMTMLCGCSPDPTFGLGGPDEPSDEELLQGTWSLIIDGTACGMVMGFGVNPGEYGEIRFCALDGTHSRWQEVHGLYDVYGAMLTLTPKVSSCPVARPFRLRFEVYDDSLRIYEPGTTTSISLDRTPARREKVSGDSSPGLIMEYGCVGSDGSFAPHALAPTGL